MVQKASKKRKVVFISLVTIIALTITGYIAYDFWAMGQKTAAIFRVPGVVGMDEKNPEKASEGSEITPVTSDDLSTYKVAADAPRVIIIERLNITARIRPMGLNSDKSIQAPKNINDAGWYTGSARPGDVGAMFIDGHSSGSTQLGLFGKLDTLRSGDTISIEKGDGVKLTYKVIHVAVIPLESVDMTQILAPYPGVAKGLNLMACTGTWVKESATLDHRVVVYTEQL